MRNQKGFTLVELLATLVILSIIMLVAVPSTMSMLDKNKKESLVSTAKRLIALAENEIRNNDKVDTDYGNFIVFQLQDLNDGTFDKDPDGHSFNQNNSYVAVHKKGSAEDYQFVYYVQLVTDNTKYKGIPLVESKMLNRDSVVNNISIKSIEKEISDASNVASPTIVDFKDLENIE